VKEKIQVLIADDHKMFREGLKVLFAIEDDIEIIGEAEDGIKAIELVRQLNPDVIILDIEMPVKNGLDVAKELIEEQLDTKILVLSRHTERVYVSEMFSTGVAGYILKDSAVDELVHAIKTVMAGQSYCSTGLVGVVVSDYSKRLSGDSQKLTAREREVLKLIAEGKQTKEIAVELSVSIKTVDTHRQRIMKKLDMHSAVELTRYAIREGLITL
jgi:DNA-binding NarL/FixJ family response regulator